MTSTYTDNITLNKKIFADYIDFCEDIGAYVIIVRSEKKFGTYATFHICGGAKQKSIKRVTSVSGKDGEELMITWPPKSKPILTYEDPENCPEEDRHYNLKIL